MKRAQPLKLRARYNLLMAPFALSSLLTIRLLQTQQNINKHTDTHSRAPQTHKIPEVCNCAFYNFVQIAVERKCPAVFVVKDSGDNRERLCVCVCVWEVHVNLM